jgi:uncharacterized protein DUF3455
MYRKLMSVAASLIALSACGSNSTTSPEPRADLNACPNLQVPANSQLVSHVFATGVQIYQWADTAWVLVSPSASLTSDVEGKASVGIHYAGPTWQATSGGKVTGAVQDRCTPNANAIPWLLLKATWDGQPGAFAGATHIQRVSTSGGLAPTIAGTKGQIVSVPYRAEYYFYRSP